MPLAILTFLVGVSYVPGLPSNAVVGRWAVFLLGAAILLWTIRDGKIVPRSLGWGHAHRIGVALLAWIVLGFAWAVSGWDHLAGLAQFTMMAVVFCVAHEEESLDLVWKALALSSFVTAGFAVAQFYGIDSVWTLSTDRFVGTFLSKSMASEIAVVALIGAIGIRAWWFVPGPLAALLLSHSRTAVLALIAAGATWAWIKRRDIDWFAVGLFSVLVASSAAALASVGKLPLLGRIEDRLEIWSAVAPQVTLWGDGLGSLSIAWSPYEFAHNEFLHYAFELGIGSLLIWKIAAHAFEADKTLERVVLAAVLAECLVGFPLHFPAVAFVAAIVAGHLCGSRVRARRAEPALGADRARGVSHPEPDGAGAIRPASARRNDIPARQEPSLVR